MTRKHDDPVQFLRDHADELEATAAEYVNLKAAAVRDAADRLEQHLHPPRR